MILRHALFHQRALRVREGVQHVAARAGERALIARFVLALERGARLLRREAGVDGHGRLFVGEENPVAIFFRQIAPRRVDVVAERHENVAQILSVPRGRPRGDRALANGQRVVGHHRFLGDLVHAAQSMTGRDRRLAPCSARNPRRTASAASADSRRCANRACARDSTAWSRCRPTSARSVCRAAAASATAGGRPSIASTSGTPTCSIRRRAYGATDSK